MKFARWLLETKETKLETKETKVGGGLLRLRLIGGLILFLKL